MKFFDDKKIRNVMVMLGIVFICLVIYSPK